MKGKGNVMSLLRLEQLMRYPEFNRLMAMKTGLWVSEEKTAELEEHRRLRREFQEDGCRGLLLPDEKNTAVFYPPVYRFDITRYAEDRWKVSYLDPLPPTHVPYFALIPGGIAYALAERCRVEMNTLFEMVSDYPREWNTRVNFRVAMMSKNLVTGAMREDLDPILSGVLNRPGGPSRVDLAVMAKKFPVKVAMYCLDRYPEMQQPFYQAFHENLLPELLDI